MKNAVLTSFTILCLLSAVFLMGLSLNIQPVQASGTIYIRADGSVVPPTAPIQRDGDIYTLTDNVHDEIVVERSSLVIDGNGYSLQGTGGGSGVYISGVNDVTIKNTNIKEFSSGIFLNKTSYNSISENTMSDNENGIRLSESSYNTIFGNRLTGNKYGIKGEPWGKTTNNIISKNNVVKNDRGIYIGSSCSDNLILQNNVTDNWRGVWLQAAEDNTISGNNILNNNGSGLYLAFSGNNVFCENMIITNECGVTLTCCPHGSQGYNIFHHNNFFNNSKQVDSDRSWNNWDEGYPSGGNYWSDFEDRYPEVKDVCNGPYQNETGSDAIWDRSYWIHGDQDNYPFVNPCTPTEHDLVASVTTPTLITFGSSSSLNATVISQGTSDETNFEFLFLVNGTIIDSTTIPLLRAGDSHTLRYLWAPTAGGTYNVTVYARPVPGETAVDNNRDTKFIAVVVVGVKAGDWVKYDYTYEDSLETPYTEWVKVEFLSVEGTTVTMRGTIHLSDGTEQNDTFTVDIADHMSLTHAPVFDTLSGFVILANSTVGYTAWIGMTDGKPCARINPHPHLFTCCGSGIEGETERTYVGTSRIVLYAKYPTGVIKYGPLTCYWDRQTGVLVEVCNTRSDGWTAKATETNMWKASSQASEETLGAYNTIESLPSGSVAILSFDFGTSTVSENIPQAKAFLSHCRRRGLRVVALAFWAAGGPLGHSVLTDVYGEGYETSEAYGTDLVFLGYVPGGHVGMQTFGDNTWNAKGTDHFGTAVANSSLMQEVRGAADFDLWIELTSGTPGEQQVIQFVQGRHQGENPDWPETGYMPLVVGATAVSVPGMMPFYEFDQIVGILNGLAGANEYEWLLSLHAFDVIWDDVNYPVLVQSNSTVSDFVFSQAEHGISFNVAGALGTIGYCNITIPKSLLWGSCTVYVNGTEIPYTKTNNSTHTFLHFTYDLSTKAVFIHATEVIPEFPAALIVPLLMALTLGVAVLLTKKRLYIKDS